MRKITILFLTFLKIGIFTFGGGYAMIALLKNEFVSKKQWITNDMFLDMVAIAESTPGPLAVNMATFVGASQGGTLGAFLATLGVISPAFFMILVIVSCMNNLLKYAGVKAFLAAVRPCVIALILATAVTMGLSVFCGIKQISDSFSINYGMIFIFLILLCIGIIAKKVKQKTPSPILMILVSACLGIVVNLV